MAISITAINHIPLLYDLHTFLYILDTHYYHIEGNFRGRKSSRLSLHDTFCELNLRIY